MDYLHRLTYDQGSTQCHRGHVPTYSTTVDDNTPLKQQTYTT